MLVQERKYMLDEFHAISELPENRDRLLELINGEIIEKMAGFEPSEIAGEILYRIKQWLEGNPIGRVSGADGSYILSPGDEVMPDVGYISKLRMPDKPARQVLMAPDLAVEVKSPFDNIRTIREKATLYLAHGTQMVWLVFPETRRVEVYTADGEIADIGLSGEIDGGQVLPGFKLEVRRLFSGE
jgi:Uma2 family endonuclease